MYDRRARKLSIAVVTALALTAGFIVPTLSAPPVSAAPSDTLVEGFNDGSASWNQAKASVTLSNATATSEGAGALQVAYDLSAGTAEAGRPSTAPAFPAQAFRALKLDYKGDSTYNTLYLKLRDATGEVLMYRVGTLQSTGWTTATIDLTKAAASSTGGDADGILDAPVALYRLAVTRNGTQPLTGTLAIDNLRGVGEGWGVPSAAPDYFAPAKGETTAFAIPAGDAGDYALTLTDGAGRTREFTGTTDGAATSITWDGLGADGVAFAGAVGATLRFDTTPDGTLTTPVSLGVPTLVTVAQADAPSETESIVVAESFDAAGSSWGQSKGTVTTAASPDHTEGSAALKLGYDLTAGSAEAGWLSSAPSFEPTAYSALRLDYKGDGTFNTLYLRLRDATGEIFYYRVGTLDSTQWATSTVDLTAAASSSTGGNANGVLDAPLSLYRLVVVRNGIQPVSGTATVDNLRTVGSGWGAPTASPEFISTAAGDVATITVPAETPGDFRVTLSDTAGHSRELAGSAEEAGEQAVQWDGKTADGANFQGAIYSVLSHDTTPDGELGKAASIGVSALTTVAELDASAAESVLSAETFDRGAAAFTQALGTVKVSTSTDRTQGSASLALAYDFAGGAAEAGYTATPPTWEAKAFNTIKLDYKGDGSFNTLYMRLRDATGEVFFYRVANINAKTWTTASVDLRSAPAAHSGGNNDGVLDAPLSLYRINLTRNGTQAAKGTVLVDNLRAIGDAWTAPTAEPAYFSAAAGQRTSIVVPMATAGDFRVTLEDPAGHSRTLSGTAAAAGRKVIAWDGKTSTGTLFEGNVGATLAYDTTPDGVLSTPTTMGIPYLGGVTARVKATAVSSTAGANSSMSTYDAISRADSDAKLMEDAYVHYAREEFEWNRVEPRQGFYEWAKFDQTVAVAKARNIDVVGKLVYTADWASSAPAGTASADARYYPPANMADWVAYVTQTVTRYKSSVTVWEVWNEPNHASFWKPGPDPALYAELLKVTYSTIKAIQPGSTVLLGGLAGFQESYMDGLIAAGAKDSFDGLGLHTYVSGAPEPSNIDSVLNAAQTYIARKIPGRTIWITEMGWSTCAACETKVTEDQQAQYLSRFMIDAASHGVKGVLWFNLREFGDGTGSLDNWGLVERSGRQKPAYTALKRFAMGTVQTVAAGFVNPGSAGASTLIDDLATTSGYTTSSMGSGGSTTLRPSTTGRISGSGALSLSYNYSSPTATGGAVTTSKAVPGSPTALSLWVYGDNSNTPLYLKFKDATGESFEAKIGNFGTPSWTRMVFYFDGLNPNYSHSGGDNDGVVDYPITVTNLHLWKSTSGVTSGQVLLDDLTAHYGTATRGAVFYGRSYVTQAVYAATARDSKLAVPNTTAYVYDRGTITTLTVADKLAATTLTTAPKFVISTPAANPLAAPARSPVTLSLVTGDRSKLTVQVSAKSGELVRTLAVDQSYLSGPRSVVWDGKKSNGEWAAAGSYMFRVQTTGPSGDISVVTRYFTVG